MKRYTLLIPIVAAVLAICAALQLRASADGSVEQPLVERALGRDQGCSFNVDEVALEFCGAWTETYSGPAGTLYAPGDDAHIMASFANGLRMRVTPGEGHVARNVDRIWAIGQVPPEFREKGAQSGSSAAVCDYFCGTAAATFWEGDCWQQAWLPPQYDVYMQCSDEGEEGCEVEVWCADNVPIGDPYDETTLQGECESQFELRLSIWGWVCVIL